MPRVYMPLVKGGTAKVISERDRLAKLIMEAIWQERKEPFVDSRLMQAAQNRANDMATLDYFGHTSPTGKTVNEFIRETGYKLPDWYPEKGNNGESIGLGYASPEKQVEGWWNSPRHKEHMTGSLDFYRGQRAIGTGMALNKEGRKIWVFLSAPAE